MRNEEFHVTIVESDTTVRLLIDLLIIELIDLHYSLAKARPFYQLAVCDNNFAFLNLLKCPCFALNFYEMLVRLFSFIDDF